MEFLFDAFLGGIFLIFLVFSGRISDSSVAADHLGAKGFPVLFSLVGLFLLTCSAWRAIRLQRGIFSESKSSRCKNFDLKENEGCHYVRLLLILALLGAYILFWDVLGFSLSTLIFVFLSILLLGYKSYFKAGLFALIFTAVLVGVFGRVFFIALPRGAGLLKEMSYHFY